MQTLTFPKDNFDQDATFRVKGYLGTFYLFCAAKDPDYNEPGRVDNDKIFVMQKGCCIKAHYTAKDDAERARLNTMEPVANGDVVEVDGRQFTVRILGDYSDAGYLIPN